MLRASQPPHEVADLRQVRLTRPGSQPLARQPGPIGSEHRVVARARVRALVLLLVEADFRAYDPAAAHVSGSPAPMYFH